MIAAYDGLGLRKRQPVSARRRATDLGERFSRMGDNAERLVGEPFKGVTTDGNVVPGLYPLGATGIPTEPIRRAAMEFLEGLDASQRQAVHVRRRLRRLASLVEHPPVHPAARPAAGRSRGPAARGGPAAGRAHAQRERVPHRARHHAAEPHHRRDHRQLDRVRRVGLLRQHVRTAVGDTSRGAGKSTVTT